jgi:hypothetical protein
VHGCDIESAIRYEDGIESQFPVVSYNPRHGGNGLHLAKGNMAPPLLIPKNHPRVSVALQQHKPRHNRELRIISQYSRRHGFRRYSQTGVGYRRARLQSKLRGS